MNAKRRLPGKRLVAMLATAGVLLNVDAAFGCSTKSKVYATALKSDLRNVVLVQERFHQDNRRYARSVAELGAAFQKRWERNQRISRALPG